MVRIPEKYFWPGLIMGLLGLSVTWWVGMLFIAQSGGGPQVVEGYYERSVDYESIQQMRRAAEKSGWSVEVDWRRGAEQGAQFQVVDRGGQPVVGLEGTVEIRRPERAGTVGKAELRAVPGTPGRYAAGVEPSRPGLWDVVLWAKHSGGSYLFEMRREVSF